jgi:myo-inositol 2-dehydrogenase/D-chiro-inositol 1-dehydrogenase
VHDVLYAVDDASRLVVAFNRRFDPAVAEVHRRVASGALGAIELVSVISKDPAGSLPIDYLRTSGGLFRDMTIHDFDMARFMLPSEPVRVSAAAASLVAPEIAEIGDVDTACITLQCADGSLGVITNSRRFTAGYDQRVEVHGSEGLARTENVPEATFAVESAQGTERDRHVYFFHDRYRASYELEWAHFVDVLRGDAEPSPTGVDGYRALLLAEAAYVALREGRTVDVEEVEAAVLGEAS